MARIKKGGHGGARPGAGAKRKTPRLGAGEWCLYVIHEKDAPWICKIGISSMSARARLLNLQVGNWRKLILAAVVRIPTESQALSIEQRIHRRIAGDRVSGEWFRIEVKAALTVVGETMVESSIVPKQKTFFE